MASIARQLSTPVALGPLLEDTVKVYEQREQDAFAAGPLRFEETKDLILKLLARYKDSTTTIVIDALDECVGEARGRLLELLEDLLKASPCLLKIFISSRDDQDIVYKLDEYPNLLLSSDRNSADIHLFVQKETEHLVRRGELLRSSMRKAELHSTIVDKLTRNARGMYVLCYLTIHIDRLLTVLGFAGLASNYRNSAASGLTKQLSKDLDDYLEL